MDVKVKFKASSIYGGKTEVFEDVVELHYNYNDSGKMPSGRMAIELNNTGYSYEIKDIEEFEIYKKLEKGNENV